MIALSARLRIQSADARPAQGVIQGGSRTPTAVSRECPP